MRVHPVTGRPYGKPATRVRDRIASADQDALKHFPTPELRAYFLANSVEAPACWPRVLDGRMDQDRFHERVERMRAAILAAPATTLNEPEGEA